MAKKDIFKVHGAKEIAKEMRDLSKGMRNKVVRPGIRRASAEVRKEAKKIVDRDTGLIRKNIKSKAITTKKGVVGRIGVLDTTDKYADGASVAKVAAVQNYGSPKRNIEGKHFLEKALKSVEPQANRIMISTTQQKLDQFHAKYQDKGKVKK